MKSSVLEAKGAAKSSTNVEKSYLWMKKPVLEAKCGSNHPQMPKKVICG